MMINNESDYEQLRAFNRSKTNMHNAQRDIFKEKIQLINDMNAVVDQAKFLNEVRKYCVDLDDCVNFDADEIGTAVSIISDDTKQRLLDSAKLRQAQRDIVAVVKTPKEKVLAWVIYLFDKNVVKSYINNMAVAEYSRRQIINIILQDFIVEKKEIIFNVMNYQKMLLM